MCHQNPSTSSPLASVWKLKDPQTSNHFQEVFNLHVSMSAGVANGATEDIWNNIKTGLLKTTEQVCGTTRSHHWRHETWWWNCCQAESFQGLEKKVKALEHHMMQPNAMPDMQCTMLFKKLTRSSRILTPNLQKYHLANQFKRENADVVGDKPVKNDAGKMSINEDSKQKAWLEHCQRLLNVEFDWDPDHLSYQPAVEGQSPLIWLRLSHRWRW